jgi:hypothetical protein
MKHMKMQYLKILLPAVLFSLVAGAQTDTRSTPMQITTSDGKTYRNATVLRADPDGLLVRFQPEQPGLGLAKVKFRNLPEQVRSQYGYDADKASAYEAEQAKGAAAVQGAAAGTGPGQDLRALVDTLRALGGQTFSSFWISVDANGKPSVQGFTGDVPPTYSGNVPPYYWWPGVNSASQGQSGGGQAGTNAPAGHY